jgi:hypothetical protein
MISNTLPKIISTSFGDVTLLQPLGKGKSGYSFLAQLNDQLVVFKRMHYEPCPYYTFSDNKVQLEVQANARLQQAGIPIPALIGFDLEQQYLIKTYVAGLVGHEWLAQGGQDETVIEQLFSISAKMRAQGLNIDYFPANFVIAQGCLSYIDYEINPYSAEWSLEQWGIYYWANRVGMAEYARNGDWSGINESANSGIPIKAPFELQVAQWKTKFQSASENSTCV